MTGVLKQNNNGFLSRQHLLAKLASTHFDVLIIGGGATGAGAALDAASRGLKTALVEANDFASGTSGRSTKLVHGGVRYLENAIKHLDRFEYVRVRDALQERKFFLENAPHLTNPLPILTPVYSWIEAFYYLTGLKLYDLLAGRASLGKSQFLSKKISLDRFPLLKPAGLKGSVLFYDGQFDDARMNLTIILSAIQEGAIALNYLQACSLIKQDDKIVGAVVKDHESDQNMSIYASIVINASGPFTDSIIKMDDEKAPDILVTSQGSHVLLSEKFSQYSNGLIIPKTKDGRVIFLLPWLGKTLAGTTDQPQEISWLPKPSAEEVEYILEYIRHYFDKSVTHKDVIATWSGLRPLVKTSSDKKTAFIPRDHLIAKSPSNLLTIVGGKWTTYRKMAEEVVDEAVHIAHLKPLNKSKTKNLKLVGARLFDANLSNVLVKKYGLENDIALHLARSYGDHAHLVLGLENASHRSRLVEGFPYIEAEVIYGVTNEYALHATDIIARRTRLAFLDNRASLLALPKIIDLMAKKLSWNDDKKHAEQNLCSAFLKTMTPPQFK